MSYADMVGPLRRAAVVVHRGRPHPEAGRRRGHRLRARRRLRAGPVRRLPGRAATTPSSASRRSCSASSPAPAGPSGCRGWSARRGPRTSSSPAGSSTRDEALRIGLVDQVVPADEVYAAAREMAARFVGGPALALRAAKEAIDRRPRDRPRHRAGARAAAVRRAVRHRGPDDRHGVVRRARPGQGRRSPGSERPVTDAEARTADRRRGRAGLEGPQARQRALPRLGGVDLRREVVDLLRRALHRLRARPLRRAVGAATAGWPYAEALELGSGTGFFLLNLMQAGVAAKGHVTDLSPGMVEAAVRNGTRARPRRRGPGRRRRVDPVRRRQLRPRRRPRGAAPHPGRRAGAARGAARAASPAAGSSSPASRPRSATGTPAGWAG